MKIRAAACPSCGGPVEFRVSTSLVTVCPFCNCVVARGDKSVADHGRVADLVETSSAIVPGTTGTFDRHGFEVIGRVQYLHPSGGVWDEWYLSFNGGRWGWLAEAQGKRYLTFEKKLKSGVVPEFSALQPGSQIVLGSRGTFTVGEIGVARTGSAQGEIPWDFVPQREHRFVDLHSEGGGFATLDYNVEPPRLFLGQEVALADLNLSDIGWDGNGFDGNTRRISALAVNCPHCAGSLELKAPDQTQRVGCPHCGALLECQHGKLEYLQTLNSRRVKPEIPLGTVGKIGATQYTVIGFMERFAMWQGRTFPWTEYLLYNAETGFRWLVNNKKHWSFVESVGPQEIRERDREATYKGTTFKLYDKGAAHVRYVVGEFYWKVTVGETVETADFIAPPRMLSYERSTDGVNQELNISLGTYISTEDVQTAFGIKELKRPLGVGVIQPTPTSGGVYPLWAVFFVVMIVAYAALDSVFSKSVDGLFFVLMLFLISIIPIGTFLYQKNFEVQRWSESDYSPYSSD